MLLKKEQIELEKERMAMDRYLPRPWLITTPLTEVELGGSSGQ